MGEERARQFQRAGQETRWVATVALIVAVVGVLLAGYAAIKAHGNANDLETYIKAEAARIEKATPVKPK